MLAMRIIPFVAGAAVGVALCAGAEKPRIFITESGTPQASADASTGEAKGALQFTGGSSPQNVEVMKAFTQRCPNFVVTSNREKADYVLRLDHEEPNPTTLFTHGNKVAVFNRNEDLIYTTSTHLLASAVKGACTAITADLKK